MAPTKKFKVGDTVEAGDHIIDTGMAGCNVDGAHLHVGIAYGGKYICPQDVFLALDKGEDVNWGVLTGKANVILPGRDRWKLLNNYSPIYWWPSCLCSPQSPHC